MSSRLSLRVWVGRGCCSDMGPLTNPLPAFSQKAPLGEFLHDLDPEDLEEDVPRRKNKAKSKVWPASAWQGRVGGGSEAEAPLSTSSWPGAQRHSQK